MTTIRGGDRARMTNFGRWIARRSSRDVENDLIQDAMLELAYRYAVRRWRPEHAQDRRTCAPRWMWAIAGLVAPGSSS